MPLLTLTNEQVIELLRQLPSQQQIEVFRYLLLNQWGEWESISTYGAGKIRSVAQERGYDWNTMTEAEREVFIDEIVHEE
ncbi:hypothetical protein BST81_02105 [Leptolyngbya sp. 'hensonii']|uniref:hypothetical protein n=1 Tax=Leptolyngbya sp. 'hensonii' TaxID=1922337 RepID=UPI00094FFA86|nr:hypothetical protein [Leptolyngbya sp. 'hensonii']OLP20054.1 hypothetical protein BST81_02105 [Leptolyngbya sp. 'hensonii']